MKIITWISSSFCSLIAEQCFFFNWHFVFSHPQLFPPPPFSISSPIQLSFMFQLLGRKHIWRRLPPQVLWGQQPPLLRQPKGKRASLQQLPQQRSNVPQLPSPKLNEPYPAHSRRGGRTNICSWVRERRGPVRWSETEKKNNVEKRIFF